jgi:transposase
MIIPNVERIYLAKGATDLRKSINTLAALVQASFEMDPYDKSMYVFCNKTRTRLKILQYDKNGFWLFYKALDTGKFAWPKETDGLMELNEEELSWLAHGLSIMDKQSITAPQMKFSY